MVGRKANPLWKPVLSLSTTESIDSASDEIVVHFSHIIASEYNLTIECIFWNAVLTRIKWLELKANVGFDINSYKNKNNNNNQEMEKQFYN